MVHMLRHYKVWRSPVSRVSLTYAGPECVRNVCHWNPKNIVITLKSEKCKVTLLLKTDKKYQAHCLSFTSHHVATTNIDFIIICTDPYLLCKACWRTNAKASYYMASHSRASCTWFMVFSRFLYIGQWTILSEHHGMERLDDTLAACWIIYPGTRV